MSGISQNTEHDAKTLQLLAEIGDWCRSSRPHTPDSQISPTSQHVDLSAMLAGDAWMTLGGMSTSKLDRLRRKIEVARKLYRFYEPDLSRPTSSEPLSASGVNRLCALMLEAALTRRDLRFLNSALKLIDGISIPSETAIAAELVTVARAALDVMIPAEARTA